ncbi:MAG: hypothetical protein AAB509_01720 [Patescibacteria group bacterium]
MDFSWTIFAFVLAGNFAWIGVMFLAQQLDKSLPPRHSVIKGSAGQKFLYMQDWYTMKYGDVIAVPLIANVYVHLVACDRILPLIEPIALALLALVMMVVGIESCLGENHKPDQGFPEIGKISLQGRIHMPYFGIGWSMGIFSLIHACFGHFTGPVLWLGIFGGVFYLGCLVAEFKSGNFNPFKKENLAEPEPTDPTKCHTCGHTFTDQNPDAGGGVCGSCWARSH